MKNLLKILPVILILSLFAGIQDVDAQSRKKKKDKKDSTDEYFDDKGDFKSHLWYGGGLSLGLSNRYFEFGVTPMVGYKFTEALSVGPRVKLLYQHYKVPFGSINYNLRTLSYGMGVFGRAKFFTNFFAHVEFEHEREGGPQINAQGTYDIDPDNPNKILSTTFPYNNFNIGAGYTSGDIFGFEIYVLYNVLADDSEFTVPYDIRFGFTYNF